jgi:hypothetical protein
MVWRILSENSIEAIDEILKKKETTSKKSTIQSMASPRTAPIPEKSSHPGRWQARSLSRLS